MTDAAFAALWTQAVNTDNPAAFVAANPEINESTLLRIHNIVHMPMRDFVRATGLSQLAFARRYCIPRRTVGNWCTNVNTPPDYLRLLIAKAEGWL